MDEKKKKALLLAYRDDLYNYTQQMENLRKEIGKSILNAVNEFAQGNPNCTSIGTNGNIYLIMGIQPFDVGPILNCIGVKILKSEGQHIAVIQADNNELYLDSDMVAGLLQVYEALINFFADGSNVSPIEVKMRAAYTQFLADYNDEPTYAIVTVKFRDDGTIHENEVIKLIPTVNADDDKIFYYVNGVEELISLIESNNGEDFTITDFDRYEFSL